jgi:hypothetical protein
MRGNAIDVLAVIRKVAMFNGGYIADDLGRVEAAVAELIEATKELRQRQREYLADPAGQRSNDKGRLVGIAAERVDAALARIKEPQSP